jgi:hypothetical protein
MYNVGLTNKDREREIQSGLEKNKIRENETQRVSVTKKD